MFHVLVDKEYEKFFNEIKLEAPDHFSVQLADFSDENEDKASLLQALKKAHALIGQVNLTEEQYQIAENLIIIQTLSAGYDRIELDRARQHQILIANNNGANAISVAEHVLMQIFALYRQLFFHHNGVCKGPWKNGKHTNRELFGKTLGIFGLGHIGKALAERALALGVQVQYFDIIRQSDLEEKWSVKYLFPDKLLETSDIVSYHVPRTQYTLNMINQESLGKMRSDSLLINAARGEIQDEEALYAALNTGKISGAGLDVFNVEPIPEDSPLRNLENVVLTPHSAPSRECYPRAVSNAVTNLERVAAGKPAESIAVDHDAATLAFLKENPEIEMNKN